MSRKTTQEETIRRAVNAVLMSVNTGLPARVEKVHADKRQVDVRPLLKTKVNGEVKSRGQITGVPVIFPTSGGFTSTLPVSRGDQVWLSFSQRSLDRWLATGGEVDPAHGRKFHISDAVAFAGVFAGGEAEPLDEAAFFGLVDGSSGVRVHPGGEVSIGTSSAELLDLVGQLGDEVESLATTLSTATVVVDPATNIGVFEPATITLIEAHGVAITLIMATLAEITK